jgi:hypothetical protein
LDRTPLNGSKNTLNLYKNYLTGQKNTEPANQPNTISAILV